MALFDDDLTSALDGSWPRAFAFLETLSQQGPALYRGLWPLLLAASGDERALAAIEKARDCGMTVNRANRGMLGYADAILAGRDGDQQRASGLAAAADRDLAHFPVWSDLARLWAAEPALADRWGEPERWLAEGAVRFAEHGIAPLAERCRRLLGGPGRRAAGPRSASPRARRTCSAWWRRVSPTGRWRRGCTSPGLSEARREPAAQDRGQVADPAGRQGRARGPSGTATD